MSTVRTLERHNPPCHESFAPPHTKSEAQLPDLAAAAVRRLAAWREGDTPQADASRSLLDGDPAMDAQGNDRSPQGEKDLVERLIKAVFEAQRRLSQREVDELLEVTPPADRA